MTGATPALPDGVHTVREPRTDVGGIPLHPVPAWTAAFPWLVHGTTGASADLGLFGAAPVGEIVARWRTLREGLRMPRAVHSEQVHGAGITEHMERLPGLFVSHGRDGHVTGYPGILLTVSLADCVAISLVDHELQRVALLHGGWRGTAAGIVEAGVDALGGDVARVHAHLGPAICGACYEVGAEVHRALGLDVPDTNTPVDLRAVQARRLIEAGVSPDRITVSAHCTKHDDGFFSHRGGDAGRQVGVLGVRR
ncbi:MAG: polyphenol oxidase family protein [Candidatus Longimicrobiales bacterium M2_2A_002]